MPEFATDDATPPDESAPPAALENRHVTPNFPLRPLCTALLAVAALTACSSLSQITGEDTVDY
ncbi:MAG TPA: hypothetical protein PL196_03545, partial [Burkholderiaceae bacterium]|nr:hypothetical protein [Burkholderiaceae bacterium]